MKFGTKLTSDLLLDSATSTGAGEAHYLWVHRKVFQIFAQTSSGLGAAIVDVEGSLDGIHFQILDTFSLSLSTAVTQDYSLDDYPWKAVRANVKSISGTGASVSVLVGV